MEVVVDLQHGREVAGRETLDFLDVHVVAAGVVAAQMVVKVGTAVHEARDVRAHRHNQPADGRELEHCVEGARAENERGRETEEVGDVLDAVGRDRPVAVLHHVEQREGGGLGVGIATRDLFGAAPLGGGKGH